MIEESRELENPQEYLALTFDQQKRMLAMNAGAARFVCNRLAAKDREIHRISEWVALQQGCHQPSDFSADKCFLYSFWKQAARRAAFRRQPWAKTE